MKNFASFSSTAANPDILTHTTPVESSGSSGSYTLKLLLEAPQPCETSLPPNRHECQFEIRVPNRASNVAPEDVLRAAKFCAIATAK